jgi:hypothetical protein
MRHIQHIQRILDLRTTRRHVTGTTTAIDRPRPGYAILLLAVLTGLFLPACNDRSTGPEPPAATDYPAWFFNAVNNDANWYFRYHPTTNQLDSFWLPHCGIPVVSADGRILYIGNKHTHVTTVLDANTLETITTLPYRFAITESPNGEWLAVEDSALFILRTSDYSVVYEDSTIDRGVFSVNSERFYGRTVQGFAWVDLADMSVERRSIQMGQILDLVPSHDESKVYVYVRVPVWFFHVFGEYEMTSSELRIQDAIFPGFGEVELSRDGRYVFYSCPGTNLDGTPGPPWIRVYDTQESVLAYEITTAGALPDPYEYGVPIGEMCFTPDGRALVALPAPSYPFVLSIDLASFTITDHVQARQWYAQGLSCQLMPYPAGRGK